MLILLQSLYAFHLISYKHSFCCYSSISLFSNSSVQLSIISIRSYSHTNSRILWLFCIIHYVMTHKLLQLGHDIQNRRRNVGGSTTGSWVELSCVALYTSTTQLNSTRRRVELGRYKRGFSQWRDQTAGEGSRPFHACCLVTPVMYASVSI